MPGKRQNAIGLLLLLFLYAPFIMAYGVGLWQAGAEDFPSFYFAARLAFDRGMSPYNHENWSLVAEISNQYVWPFLYPPPSLAFFRILNAVSYTTARQTFLIGNHLLLLAAFWIVVVKIIRIKPAQLMGLLCAAYVLTFQPLGETLRYGQVNLVILVLICLWWLFLKQKQHPALTALPLSLAVVVKIYPAILFGYLLVKCQFKVLLWGLVFLVLISLITLPGLPPGTWADWMVNVASSGYGSWVRGIDPAMLANQSINGFTSRLFLGRSEFILPLLESAEAARYVPLVLSVLVGLFSFAVVWRSHMKRPPNEVNDHEIGLLLLAMALIAPITWEHQLVFILPAVLLALDRALNKEDHQLWRVIFLAAAALLLAVPALPQPRETLPTLQGLLVSVRFFATGALWIYTLIELSGQKWATPKPGKDYGGASI
jgi:hypothetical protein